MGSIIFGLMTLGIMGIVITPRIKILRIIGLIAHPVLTSLSITTFSITKLNIVA
jgi:hypothetical protein